MRKTQILSRDLGFTLIELLIVLGIITLMLNVVLPVSYSMYKRYKYSLEAEKVLMLISSLKRKAFLYNKKVIIDTKEGKLVVNGSLRDNFKDIFIQTEHPIIFYKNGTTSGGRIILSTKNNTFYININAPLGKLKLTTKKEDGKYEKGIYTH